MSTTGDTQSDRRRWWYLLVLLLLVLLCLAFLVLTGRLPGTAAGGPTATPTTVVNLTEVTDQPTEPATETEKPTEAPTETETPGTGVCLTPCDPAKSVCDDGLSCVKDNLGKYICWGGTDSKGEYCGPTADQKCGCRGSDYVCTLSNGQTTTSPNDPKCAPAQPTCDCKGTDYICTNPDGSVASASYNSTACGGNGGCDCRGPDLYCADGTVAQFNPQCMGGGPVCQLNLRICNSKGFSDFDPKTCTCYTS